MQRESTNTVIPAKAGIHLSAGVSESVDPGLSVSSETPVALSGGRNDNAQQSVATPTHRCGRAVRFLALLLPPQGGAVLLLLFLLSACDVPDWLGEDEEGAPLPGERVAILGVSSVLKADPGMEGVEVMVPEALPNTAWPQAGANAASVAANVLLPAAFSLQQEVTIGDGETWENAMVPSPVIGDGRLFAMDATGHISAHDALALERVLWQSVTGVEKEALPVLGGGLAYSQDRLFATTGYGRIFALDAKNGKVLWEQAVNIPLRAAPRVHGRRVFALSADNQLFAFSAVNGTLLWTHRGISETAGFLAPVTPSASEDVVVAPYSSGTLHGIDAIRGMELWSDTLSLTRRTQASATLAGIGGNPVIANGVVFAASNNGFMAASLLRNGRRLWEQTISAGSTPWLAGQFIYVLSPDYQLVALRAVDGAAKWVQQLPGFDDIEDRSGRLHWHSPMMAGGKLYVTGTHGEMLRITPGTGETEAVLTIPDDVYAHPIVAGGRLYLLGRDAQVRVYY